MAEKRFGENDVFAAVAREGAMFLGKKEAPVKAAKKKAKKKAVKKSGKR
jgi:hypothetical protein